MDSGASARCARSGAITRCLRWAFNECSTSTSTVKPHRNSAAVHTESTAFVVCHALGLDTSECSFPYVAEWAHGTEAAKQLASTGQRILTAATRLLEVLAPEATEQKEAA